MYLSVTKFIYVDVCIHACVSVCTHERERERDVGRDMKSNERRVVIISSPEFTGRSDVFKNVIHHSGWHFSTIKDALDLKN